MKWGYFKILISLLPLLLFWLFNHQNMPLQFSLILGMIVFPYIVKKSTIIGGYKYAVLALLASLLLLCFRSNSLFYFSSIFICLFIIEQWWGRLNVLPLLLTIVVSPVISNIVYIWSFPIRLKLTHWAGWSIQKIGLDIQTTGNILIQNGVSFSVDPACIGLNMMVTSFVIGLVIMAYFEKKYHYTFSFRISLILLGIIAATAIVANFTRLLMLIIFHILPENPLHDLVGLLSLLVYTLLPFYFLVQLFVKKYGLQNLAISKKTNANEGYIGDQSALKESASFHRPLHAFIIFALIALQVLNGQQFLTEPMEHIDSLANIHLEGFQEELTPNGVLKLKSEEALIYIKPPVHFFQGSHDPRFCWQGSGYKFTTVRIETVANKSIYTALLSKDTDQIYTAWWYENESEQTPHEWNWRWKSLKGNGNYYMVNVNCTNRETLEKWIGKNMLF